VSGGDIFGTYGSARLAKELQAMAVLFINDVWMMKNYADVHTGQPWRTLAYVPLDGDVTNPNDLLGLTFLDMVVGYHDNAQRQFSTGFKALAQTNTIAKAPRVEAVFHGVDTHIFSVDPSLLETPGWRMQYKSQFFGHIDGWENSIFVLNANRFNVRKDLKTTVDGFAMALQRTDKPMYLCMHVPAIKDFELEQLRNWIDAQGIAQSALINPVSDTYVDDETLCALYKACEVGINTSFGEGWGLISFEHGACGGAQIVPAQSGLQDIWQDHVLYIDPDAPVTLMTNPFEMRSSSPESLAAQIATLVDDPELLHQMSLRASHHANKPEFRWETIAERWKEVLEELIS
jgi:glycosyltransferase involved in cell wall biosynthesis